MTDQAGVQFIEDMASATEFQLKHTPNVTLDSSGDNTVINAGIGLAGISHPQTEEHYIAWIALYDGDVLIEKVDFSPTEIPVASFTFIKDSQQLIVQAFCNLHGTFGAVVE